MEKLVVVENVIDFVGRRRTGGRAGGGMGWIGREEEGEGDGDEDEQEEEERKEKERERVEEVALVDVSSRGGRHR